MALELVAATNALPDIFIGDVIGVFCRDGNAASSKGARDFGGPGLELGAVGVRSHVRDHEGS